MCNAWNHRIDCTCGWGGVGHSGRREIKNTNHYPNGIPPIKSQERSYTCPNASCPVCGESVFYFCNTNGSSIFFDHLGPPWPKHPCTDKATKYTPSLLPLEKRLLSQSKDWQKGFKLYKMQSQKNLADASVWKLKFCELGEHSDIGGSDQEIVYVPTGPISQKDLTCLLKSAVVFIKSNWPIFTLSFLSNSYNPLTTTGYSSLEKCTSRAPQKLPDDHKLHKVNESKPGSEKTITSSTPKNRQNHHKQVETEQYDTAISLALKKARDASK